jgi:hypothetical protein
MAKELSNGLYLITAFNAAKENTNPPRVPFVMEVVNGIEGSSRDFLIEADKWEAAKAAGNIVFFSADSAREFSSSAIHKVPDNASAARSAFTPDDAVVLLENRGFETALLKIANSNSRGKEAEELGGLATTLHKVVKDKLDAEGIQKDDPAQQTNPWVKALHQIADDLAASGNFRDAPAKTVAK